MNKKLTLVVNLGIVLALMLAMLPMQGALANSRTNGEFKLIFPNSGEVCARYAKANVLGQAQGATVEYTFYSWVTGSPVMLGTVTAPLGEPVRYEYPGGVGNGRYSVVATVFDSAGGRLWKVGAKWLVTCTKAAPGQ